MEVSDLFSWEAKPDSWAAWASLRWGGGEMWGQFPPCSLPTPFPCYWGEVVCQGGLCRPVWLASRTEKPPCSLPSLPPTLWPHTPSALGCLLAELGAVAGQRNSGLMELKPPIAPRDLIFLSAEYTHFHASLDQTTWIAMTCVLGSLGLGMGEDPQWQQGVWGTCLMRTFLIGPFSFIHLPLAGPSALGSVQEHSLTPSQCQRCLPPSTKGWMCILFVPNPICAAWRNLYRLDQLCLRLFKCLYLAFIIIWEMVLLDPVWC